MERSAMTDALRSLRSLLLLLSCLVHGGLGISDVHAEPFGLEAHAEVPVYVSFTTGRHEYYDRPYEDDGTVRMMLSLQLNVFCRPEIDPCQYVELGINNDCSKLLEAPGLPPVVRCVLGPYGIMTLQLAGSLSKTTRYDLVVLGTLPAAGQRLIGATIRILEPAAFLDLAALTSYEVAQVTFAKELLVQQRAPAHITAVELVSPVTAQQDVTLQQYLFRVTGSDTSFAAGDQIRLFASPFIHPDEGLSFGGTCDGFDVSGFSSPLADASCEVVAVPAVDARVGYNVIVLTFGPLASLARVPQYFRVALNTPKRVGSMGLWFAASRDASSPGGEDPTAFSRLVSANGAFFVAPVLHVTRQMGEPVPTYGATHELIVTVLASVNMLGNTVAPPRVSINPPAFFQVTQCSLAAGVGNGPKVTIVNAGQADARCLASLENNMNIYSHQSFSLRLTVRNPSFPVEADVWKVVLMSGDGSMSSAQTFPGWPVLRALENAFIVPLNMEYEAWNEVQVFFRPAVTTPAEPRVVIVAPYGYTFVGECGFDVILGFPKQGVQCSLPLSEVGRNLFTLRMPIMTAFTEGTTYAVNIYPLRNPYLGSHSSGSDLDSLPWRIDLATMDGSIVLGTWRDAPIGPHLRGFTIYPHALLDPDVLPSTRAPSAENVILLRFRVAVHISAHGERLRVTAPAGYRWKIGARVVIGISVPREAPGDSVDDASKVPISALSYDESYPPVVAPHNQIELAFIMPDIQPGTDLSLHGTVLNAAIEPLLNEDAVSANVWILEFYEPGAGYLKYEFRHQAVVFPGFTMKAITGGSASAWLSFASFTQTYIMITFRLGTALVASSSQIQYILEVIAPEGFFFPQDCVAQRISPTHLEVDGYTHLPPESISSCRGGGEDANAGAERVAHIILANGAELKQRVLYAFQLEGVLPDTLPFENTWTIRSLVGGTLLEEEKGIAGFRLSTELLSIVYHPGTVDTGEDLRVGASENRVMFSMQLSSVVEPGGALRITAPYRFSFARECKYTVYSARDILSSLSGSEESTLYFDLPVVASCLGERNVARLTFTQRLDVAIRYSFRIAVSNPVLPHPPDWPLPQRLWRLETFDVLGGPLNSAEVSAFSLWAFEYVAVAPLVQGTSERTLVTIDLEPSLTVPPDGFLLITAPKGFVFPVNPDCVDFQRDTHNEADGYRALPPTTTCSRGPGGPHVVKVQIDGKSYLASAERFRFRIGIESPPEPTSSRRKGGLWSIASAELTSIGEAFLEQNPAIEGLPVHERLKAFFVETADPLAGSSSVATLEFALHDSLGTFEVLTTTEASFLVVDMPILFATRVLDDKRGTAGGMTLYACEEFVPLYPESSYFPALLDGCSAPQSQPSFRLRLSRNLLVGPDYRFRIGVQNPFLDSLRQKQLALVNVWQLRLVRIIDKDDVTFTGRSTEGFRVVPRLYSNLTVWQPMPSVNSQTLVSIYFKVVSSLAGVRSDTFYVRPPSSISSYVGRAPADAVPAPVCQLWLDKVQQASELFVCGPDGSNGLVIRLAGSIVIAGETVVQLDFDVLTGSVPLNSGSEENRWALMTQTSSSDVLDMEQNLQGFMVFPALTVAEVIPSNLAAMSFANHAEFRFQVPNNILGRSQLHLRAPEGFVLYPLTFRPTEDLGGGDVALTPTVTQDGGDKSSVVISFKVPLLEGTLFSFKLTVGNPAVSPPLNDWTLRLSDLNDQTLCIDPAVPGFVVESPFRLTALEGQLDEPFAENYVHVTVAVNERLAADSVLARSTCMPTVDRPVCPIREGLETFIVVEAPPGFYFLDTCGYWSLQRAGSRRDPLPPGSLCRGDRQRRNVARVQVAQSLEPMRIYEFTLQVRNALSVPRANFWRLTALQSGVIREVDSAVAGFELRQMRSLQITPSTTLAGVVDNIVTLQMRSERPVTRGAVVVVVAPAGFVFDEDRVTSSFTHPLTVNLEAHELGSALRCSIDERDFVPPNMYFFISVAVRNPPTSPDAESNYWHVYVQSRFLEHIDLRKFFPGFVVAYKMLFCQAYPNDFLWELGASNDVSMLFVTETSLFLPASAGKPEYEWTLVLATPIGFRFSTEGAFSKRCSGFRRWGGLESYDQLPETVGAILGCEVRTANSVAIRVPTTAVPETRYSFRLNVTVASRLADIARQEPWRLTVLRDGEIVHVGESPSPLIGTYYEPQWFWAPDEDGSQQAQ